MWLEVLQLRDIPAPPGPKACVMGPDLGRWCKFNKVKGHKAEDYNQLKKEVVRLFQERYLKRHAKCNLSQGSNISNSCGRDEEGSPKSRKGKDPSKYEDNKLVRHTPNTITREFVEGGETSPGRKIYAH